MTMHKALHPEDAIDSMWQEKKEEALSIVKMPKIQGYEEYTKKIDHNSQQQQYWQDSRIIKKTSKLKMRSLTTVWYD